MIKNRQLTSQQRKKVVDNIPLAKMIAYKVWRRYPLYCLDDLMQAGYLGLISAVLGFDESKGFKFSTYAWKCITGYIRHYIRDTSEMIKTPRGDYSPFSVGSFNVKGQESSEEFVSSIPDPHQQTQMIDQEERDLLMAAIGTLPEILREIIQWRYLDELSVQEICQRLGVSESRVNQQKRKALGLLRERINYV